MHICKTLQSKLNELKGSIEKPLEVVDSVSEVEKFEDFKKTKEEVEYELQEKSEDFENRKKELEWLKLNFKEELLKYLGVDEEDFAIEPYEEGYVKVIKRKTI